MRTIEMTAIKEIPQEEMDRRINSLPPLINEIINNKIKDLTDAQRFEFVYRFTCSTVLSFLTSVSDLRGENNLEDALNLFSNITNEITQNLSIYFSNKDEIKN